MKKIFLILAVIAMVGLNSCKKDWSCQCTNQNGSTTSTAINNETLLNARAKCKDMNSSNSILGTSETCSLQ